MEENQSTIMRLKVDLQCQKCYKKVKKVLCKFPEIRDQVYDEKKNLVTIRVVCHNPDKIRDKLYCKGRDFIDSIEISTTEASEHEEKKHMKNETLSLKPKVKLLAMAMHREKDPQDDDSDISFAGSNGQPTTDNDDLTQDPHAPERMWGEIDWVEQVPKPQLPRPPLPPPPSSSTHVEWFCYGGYYRKTIYDDYGFDGNGSKYNYD